MKFEDAGDGKFNVIVTDSDMWEFHSFLTAQGIVPGDFSPDEIQEKFFAWCRDKRTEELAVEKNIH